MAPSTLYVSYALRGIALSAAALIGGCGNSLESDIRKRFAEQHDRPLCVEFKSAFPATADFGYGRDIERWLLALEEGGLLSAREIPKPGALPMGLSGRRIGGGHCGPPARKRGAAARSAW